MKKHEIAQVVLLILMIVLFFVPLLFWIFNPALTFMQVTIKFWWILVFDVVSTLSIYLLEDKNDIIF